MGGWRAAGSVAVWAAATALSAGLVWLGLQPVLRTAVPDRVEVESGAALRDAGDGAAAPPTPSPPVPTGTTPSPATPTAAGTATTAVPRPSASPTTEPPVVRTSAPPATVDGWTLVSERDGSTSYLRQFEVPGGTATIRMTPGRVHLVSATPNPGYTMDTLQGQPDRLVVRFWTSSRIHTVDAIWWNDRPYAEVSDNA
ncbi:DNA mismatch repair protein MutL [Polymorphospora rubra]|nr:DNA mismatch repair protein MutL [Polymorphospora rubra]